MIVQSLVRPLMLNRLEPEQHRFISALRLWAVAARLRWCPIRTVTERLGSARAAAHFRLILEEVGAAWPDPFCVSPPCATHLSHDEATAVEMLHWAGRGDRPAFDRLLADLLPQDERERLFLSFSVFTTVLHG